MEKQYIEFLNKYSFVHTLDQIKILESDIGRSEDSDEKKYLKTKLNIAKDIYAIQKKFTKIPKIIKIFSITIIF